MEFKKLKSENRRPQQTQDANMPSSRSECREHSHAEADWRFHLECRGQVLSRVSGFKVLGCKL